MKGAPLPSPSLLYDVVSSPLYVKFLHRPGTQVLEGMDLVDKLQYVQTDRRSRPLKPVVIADCGVL